MKTPPAGGVAGGVKRSDVQQIAGRLLSAYAAVAAACTCGELARAVTAAHCASGFHMTLRHNDHMAVIAHIRSHASGFAVAHVVVTVWIRIALCL